MAGDEDRTGLFMRYVASDSPISYLPWVFRMVFKVAPVDAMLNIGASILQGLAPAAMVLVIQNVIDAMSYGADMERFTLGLSQFAAVFLVVGLTGAVFPATNNRIFEKCTLTVQELVLTKGATLSLSQHDNPETQNIIERASKGQGYRLAMLWVTVVRSTMSAIRVLSALAVLTHVSPLLFPLPFLAALPITWVGIRQGKRVFTLFRQQAENRRRGDYFASLLTSRSAATEMRSYHLLGYFLDRWRDAFEERRSKLLRTSKLGAVEGTFADLGAAVMLVGSLALITYVVKSGNVQAGAIVAIVGAVRVLQESMLQFATEVAQVWERGLPLMDLKKFLTLAETEPPAQEGAPFPRPFKGSIRFENVSFTYPGQAQPTLDGITFEILRGEKISLVGVNGAGKSTLAKLLLGLYAPTSGRITIEGIDIQEIAPAALRQNVSCIFQEFVRYELTVQENVNVGRAESSLQEVEQACAAAGADGFIESLPQRYQTQLGRSFQGGIELSGGQWQRIALARALLRDAQIIILDERTAAMDPKAELALFGKFSELMQRRTAILISHRLGSARMSDRVLVLGNGKIIEDGHHDQLMALKGEYARLFTAQAQWYQD